jgi:hypothetical protein
MRPLAGGSLHSGSPPSLPIPRTVAGTRSAAHTLCTHYRKRSLYRELASVPRARSQALGTETLCREQRVQLSAQKKPAVQTYCAEREQSRLSAQASTHDTEYLCRELQRRALGTAATSRRNVTAVMAVCPAVKCAGSPLLALGTEHLCRVPATGSRQRIKKNQIHTFKPFLHQPTPLQKAYAQISHKNIYLFCI